jgi:hypothetical protein
MFSNFFCGFCSEHFSPQYLTSILAMRTEMHVCRHVKCLVLSITEMCWHIPTKLLNMTFHENQFSRSWVVNVLVDRQTGNTAQCYPEGGRKFITYNLWSSLNVLLKVTSAAACTARIVTFKTMLDSINKACMFIIWDRVVNNLPDIVNFLVSLRICLCHHMQTGLGLLQPPVLEVLGVQRSEDEIYHAPVSSTEVYKVLKFTSTLFRM